MVACCDIYPNGEELVERFKDVKQGDYDAILMDVQMPVMDAHVSKPLDIALLERIVRNRCL